jgi:RAT1-interacting protein
VNTFREFDVVFKAKLGRHRLIFGAEVDGLDADGKTFIELKTVHERLEHSVLMQDRFMRFWAQSFLAGIDKIVVGRRSDRGFLKKLEYLQVAALPRMVRGMVSWCPEAMLNFGTEVLDWLQSMFLEEESVHRLSFDGNRINLLPLPEYPVFVPSTFQACLYY